MNLFRKDKASLASRILIIGKYTQVFLSLKTQRSDDGYRHFSHPQAHRHRGKTALKIEVHHGCMYNIIHMVSQSYFITPQPLRHYKYLLTPVPRTKETRGLTIIRRRIKTCRNAMEPHSSVFTEIPQISLVRLILYVFHPYMQCINGE